MRSFGYLKKMLLVAPTLALAQLGVSRLDWAVLTHPHPDHGGGLVAVLDHLPVRELWTTGEPGPLFATLSSNCNAR